MVSIASSGCSRCRPGPRRRPAGRPRVVLQPVGAVDDPGEELAVHRLAELLTLLDHQRERRGLLPQVTALVGAQARLTWCSRAATGRRTAATRRGRRTMRSGAHASRAQSVGLPSRRNPTPRTATTFSWTLRSTRAARSRSPARSTRSRSGPTRTPSAGLAGPATVAAPAPSAAPTWLLRPPPRRRRSSGARRRGRCRRRGGPRASPCRRRPPRRAAPPTVQRSRGRTANGSNWKCAHRVAVRDAGRRRRGRGRRTAAASCSGASGHELSECG